MKKSEQKKLNETLDKALSPPPRRMTAQALDSLLDEYDEAQPKREEATAVPQYRSTAVPILLPQSALVESTIESTYKTRSTGVPEYRSTEVGPILVSPVPTKEFYRKPNQTADHLDRQLTPAESKVLDHLVRLSVGFNKDRCQVRISVLMDRTGYRSDKTVRTAIIGLEIKGLIKRADHANSPAGDIYVIQPYSGNTGVPEYRSTAAKNTPVLESKITGQLNTVLKDKNIDDDAALSAMIETLKTATKEITGRDIISTESERWKELADVLIAELKIAAARTTVSNVPAFLAEHLRRRLWKIDKKQARAEGRELPDEVISAPQSALDTSSCPDCGGSGWWYPEGEAKGVAKCSHAQLNKEQGSSS
jgi:hypothetical protein